MKNEFILILNELLEEKQLSKEVILSAIEAALVSAYRKDNATTDCQKIEAKLDPETGDFRIFSEKEVVESVENKFTEVSLEDAQKVDPNAKIGDMVVVDSTPSSFGRVAAQTAKQVIQQHIRDAERNEQVEYFEKLEANREIVSGIVQSISYSQDGSGTIESMTVGGLEKKAEGIMLRNNLLPNDHFKIHDRIRAIVSNVTDSLHGSQIILSRTDRDFLKRLIEEEVPETRNGTVEIKGIVREPGVRAKIAVVAKQQGIDAVGCCVGQHAVRIQTIVHELRDERIDVIEWNANPTVFITKSLSPAKVVGVYLGEGKNATVVVPENQSSLAIGIKGQNVRLAAKLTGYKIDIKGVMETASELIKSYETEDLIQIPGEEGAEPQTITRDELFADEKDNIDSIRTILAKNDENRPISDEENERVNQFVDRIEKRKSARINEVSVADTLKKLDERQLSRSELLNLTIRESGLPKHVSAILKDLGVRTFDDLYQMIKKDPGSILTISSFTNKETNDVLSVSAFAGKYENMEETNSAGAEEGTETAELTPEAEPNPVETVAPEMPVAETEEVKPEESESDTEKGTLPDQPESEMEIAEPKPEETEESQDINKLFDLNNLNVTETDAIEKGDDEEFGDSGSSKGKKKRKKKNVSIEYDDESDETVVHRKHKRGGDDEEWGWNS